MCSSAYDVASQDDFWAILTEVAQKDDRLPTSVTVKDIMDTWTLQAGYPVVTVTRSKDGHTATLTQVSLAPSVSTSMLPHFFFPLLTPPPSSPLLQERFLQTGNITGEEKACSWWVPLSYTTADAPDFNETQPSLWMPAGEAAIVVEDLPAKGDWIFFNLQGTGYFRVNYDEDNWARLSDQLLSDHATIDVVSRSQLLDDALSLARVGELCCVAPVARKLLACLGESNLCSLTYSSVRPSSVPGSVEENQVLPSEIHFVSLVNCFAGRLSYETALGLNAYLEAEKEYVPWSTALAGLSYLEKMLTRTASYGNLRVRSHRLDGGEGEGGIRWARMKSQYEQRQRRGRETRTTGRQ